MFQFHIGSIKRENFPNLDDADDEFQFHIGSIKSVTPAPAIVSEYIKFQFHIGSIKSAEYVFWRTVWQ